MTNREIRELANEYYKTTQIPHHTEMGFGSVAQILDAKLVYRIMKWVLERKKPGSTQTGGDK